jgi:hypothetical protein
LESGTGTRTAELLRLWPAGVGDEESAIEGEQGLLQDVLGMFIDKFLVVGDDALGNGLSNGVNLRRVATTLDPNPDVEVLKVVGPEDQDGFVDLGPQDRRLDEHERLSVDLDETVARA